MTDVTDNNPDTNTPEPITIESVSSLSPDSLTDDQKTFIKDNAGELSDEQKEAFKSVLEESGEPEVIDPEKVEIKTRVKVEEKKEEKGDEDEEIEVDPADKKTIGKVVDDKLTDLRGTVDEVQKIKDNQEVDRYIADNQEFKPYRGVMLKYLSHPAYKNIPVENIASIVASADLQKLGAKKERDAQKKVKDTQGGGNTVRKPSGGKTDWLSATQAEFQKKKNEVLGIK